MPGELTCYTGSSRVSSQTRVADGRLRFHPYEITLVLFNKLVKKFPRGCVMHVAVICHYAVHIFRKANRSMDLNLKRHDNCHNHATVYLTGKYGYSSNYSRTSSNKILT